MRFQWNDSHPRRCGYCEIPIPLSPDCNRRFANRRRLSPPSPEGRWRHDRRRIVRPGAPVGGRPPPHRVGPRTSPGCGHAGTFAPGRFRGVGRGSGQRRSGVGARWRAGRGSGSETGASHFRQAKDERPPRPENAGVPRGVSSRRGRLESADDCAALGAADFGAAGFEPPPPARCGRHWRLQKAGGVGRSGLSVPRLRSDSPGRTRSWLHRRTGWRRPHRPIHSDRWSWLGRFRPRRRRPHILVRGTLEATARGCRPGRNREGNAGVGAARESSFLGRREAVNLA